jgi:excisionase family DNA binding protein
MEKLFTCEEVAERYRVKVVTVWSWIRNGKLKAFRPAKSYLIPQSALEQFENSVHS